jgi:hypothetical protein
MARRKRRELGEGEGMRAFRIDGLIDALALLYSGDLGAKNGWGKLSSNG